MISVHSCWILSMDNCCLLSLSIFLDINHIWFTWFCTFNTLNLNMTIEGNAFPITKWKVILILSTKGFKAFMDTFLLYLHKIIHKVYLERMTEEFWAMLQQRDGCKVGDWFLYPDYTILSIYVFQGRPYQLPFYILLIFYGIFQTNNRPQWIAFLIKKPKSQLFCPWRNNVFCD